MMGASFRLAFVFAAIGSAATYSCTEYGEEAPPAGLEGDGGTNRANPSALTGPSCKKSDDCPAIKTNPAECSEPKCESGKCAYVSKDKDKDGHPSADACDATEAKVTVTLGDDCDDADPNLFPGNPRSCGLDQAGNKIVFPSGAPVGACKYGSQSCVAGKPGPCAGAIGPKATEDCATATADDNCNGSINEGCACTDGATQACGSNVGQCKPGTQSCVGGKWGNCTGAVVAVPRNCESGADNDCNGKPDNTECPCPVGASQACNSGQAGICSAGSQTCFASADKTTSGYGACGATRAPEAMACDGLDHNCNGIVDLEDERDLDPADVGRVCAKLLLCPGADRDEICFRNDIGYTGSSYGNCTVANRRTVGYMKWYDSQGINYPAPPGGYYRMAKNGTGLMFGPMGVATTCCPAAAGCTAFPFDPNTRKMQMSRPGP